MREKPAPFALLADIGAKAVCDVLGLLSFQGQKIARTRSASPQREERPNRCNAGRSSKLARIGDRIDMHYIARAGAPSTAFHRLRSPRLPSLFPFSVTTGCPYEPLFFGVVFFTLSASFGRMNSR